MDTEIHNKTHDRIADGFGWGFSLGLFILAVVTILFNMAIYSSLKNQRDFWKGAYCYETKVELDFCRDYPRLTIPEELL